MFLLNEHSISVMDFAGFSVNLVERVENVELVKELTALLYKNVLEWP